MQQEFGYNTGTEGVAALPYPARYGALGLCAIHIKADGRIVCYFTLNDQLGGKRAESSKATDLCASKRVTLNSGQDVGPSSFNLCTDGGWRAVDLKRSKESVR